MTGSRLTDRLRDIVRGSRSAPPAGRAVDTSGGSAATIGSDLAASAAAALGGEVVETDNGPSVRVVRTYPADHRHGVVRIGDCHEDLHRHGAAFRVLTGGRESLADAEAPPLPTFVDIETTGLSGGAGTYAFLVGCARFDGPVLRVDQFFMVGHALERALLDVVRRSVESSGALVTYNGKSFDVPVLETRFLYHRQPPPFSERPHLDMLHPARRLWRGARGIVRAPGAQGEGCALSVMEQALFGFRRYGDVPGFEIPTRFFRFLRSSDAQPLLPVFEHNRLDLVSLAALTARAVRLVRDDPDQVEDARECYGVGRLLEQTGEEAIAERWLMRAVMLGARSWHAAGADVRLQALRALALRCRREERYAEAAAHWEAIASARWCNPVMMREALEALAIHHEHRSKDLERATRYAERSRAVSRASSHGASVEHRLSRLRRKVRRTEGMLLPS